MAIRYPNGKLYKATPTETPAASKSKKKDKDFSYSNRGKSLEDDLNETNAFYLQKNLANIHKKPVPVQIVKVEYPSRSAAVIREAYFRTPSTTDYNGVWNGYYIDFEAKETESKTAFPLKNIHLHQVTHMKSVKMQKGITFFIIRFSALMRDFIVPFEVIESAWQQMEEGGRKSIPLTIFEQQTVEVKTGYNPRLDYLSAVKKFIANKTVCESEEI
ncbi:Holliday junction resolvase RecU [Solibacillus sp. FSL H8-0538]|uniref:Holliday junction resolvase RecU n=1 Tax=Solibacillus sp. FSL H8-0538 TaxID=2921400 RepID=UPI0030FCD241